MLKYYKQWQLALIFIAVGIACGIVFGIFTFIRIITGNKKFMQIITDALSTICIAIIYVIAINIFNWGVHRFFLILLMFVGILLERKTLGKLFAKLYNLLYNLVVSRIRVVSNSKLGRILRR